MTRELYFRKVTGELGGYTAHMDEKDREVVGYGLTRDEAKADAGKRLAARITALVSFGVEVPGYFIERMAPGFTMKHYRLVLDYKPSAKVG